MSPHSVTEVGKVFCSLIKVSILKTKQKKIVVKVLHQLLHLSKRKGKKGKVNTNISTKNIHIMKNKTGYSLILNNTRVLFKTLH